MRGVQGNDHPDRSWDSRPVSSFSRILHRWSCTRLCPPPCDSEHTSNAVEPFKGNASLFLYLKYESVDQAALLTTAALSLNPVRLQLRARHADENRWSGTKCRRPPRGTHKWIFGVTSFDQSECFAMVRVEEAKRRRLYDFVVKLRPDEQLCRPLPSWQRLVAYDRIAVYGKPKRVGPEIHDHVAVMRRPLADRYFSAQHEIDDCVAPTAYDSHCHVKAGQRPHNDTPTECMLSRWLWKGGVAYDNGDVLGHSTVCLWRHQNTTGLLCDLGTRRMLHAVSSPCA